MWPLDVIAALAEEHFAASFAASLGAGALQGAILARGVRRRFPSLKSHARAASLVMLALFLISSTASIVNFALPDKVDLSGIGAPGDAESLLGAVLLVAGVDGGFWTVMAMSATVIIAVFFRFAELPAVARGFVLLVTLAATAAALASRFTIYEPTAFQVSLYALYQAGIAVGAYAVMRRRGAPGEGWDIS